MHLKSAQRVESVLLQPIKNAPIVITLNWSYESFSHSSKLTVDRNLLGMHDIWLNEAAGSRFDISLKAAGDLTSQEVEENKLVVALTQLGTTGLVTELGPKQHWYGAFISPEREGTEHYGLTVLNTIPFYEIIMPLSTEEYEKLAEQILASKKERKKLWFSLEISQQRKEKE